jgi:lipopolysaccharide/colanic/teichoic acid biosynthesis glycosyltransferase
MLKRLFDIVASLIGLVVLAVPLAIVAVVVRLDSPGSPVYRQIRLGKDGDWFYILKIRTMALRDEPGAEITVSGDKRVTRIGRFLRRWKIDEFPQLLNVLFGQMSIVGPRPETLEYGFVYPEQDEVRKVRPGITDPASIRFRDESELLEQAEDPDSYYREVILPEKIRLNLEYQRERSFARDMRLIVQTLSEVFLRREGRSSEAEQATGEAG